MSRLLYFIKKESLHILRDVRTLLVVIGIPVILMFMFGFAVSTDVNNVNVAVCAPVRSESVERLVSQISHNELFTVVGYVGADEVDDVMRRGDAGAVVVFAENFDRIIAGKDPGRKAVQLVLDGSNPNVAASATAYLTGLIGESFSNMNPVDMIESHILYNPQMKSSYNFVPGILGLIFILVCAMMTSISIVREKEMGTMEVLLVSPVRPIWIIVAKMVPYFILSCVNLLTVMLIAKFALDVPMTGSMTGIIIISMVYILLSLSLGLMISTITDKQIVALLISGMLLMLPIMMFSGMLFPTENMPMVLKPFTYIVPARWYIDAMRKLMIEGLDFSDVMLEFGILCGVALLILGVALKKFNDRLE